MKNSPDVATPELQCCFCLALQVCFHLLFSFTSFLSLFCICALTLQTCRFSPENPTETKLLLRLLHSPSVTALWKLPCREDPVLHMRTTALPGFIQAASPLVSFFGDSLPFPVQSRLHRTHNPLPTRTFQYDFQYINFMQERNRKIGKWKPRMPWSRPMVEFPRQEN